MLESITKHIKDRFPEDRFQKIYSDELIRICAAFIESGFADPEFINELTSDLDENFWPRVSEALIFERIQKKEFETPTKPGIGPDFLLRHENLRIWVEVICPQPVRLGNWCSIQPNIRSSVPHDEILLRWTSAIKEKKRKTARIRQKIYCWIS